MKQGGVCCTSAAEDGTYASTGSTAELFDGTFKKGAHYVDVTGVPVWEVHDNSGVVQGSVKGRVPDQCRAGTQGMGWPVLGPSTLCCM